MKQSEIYLKAQIAVVKSETMNVLEKLEVLRELMQKENVALYVEQKEEEGDTA